MDAVISGQAGVALLWEGGGNLSSIHAGRGHEVVSRRDDEISWLFGEAKDLRFLEEVDLPVVRRELDLASTQAEALQIALILLDGTLPADIRRDAAEELHALFLVPKVEDFVQGVLYAHPLPREADLAGAHASCAGPTEKARAFLRDLGASQSAISEVRQAWNAIPTQVFGSEEDRAYAQAVCVREGFFRDLVLNRSQHEPIDSFRLQVLLEPSLREVKNVRALVQEWIFPLGTQEKADRYAEELASNRAASIAEPGEEEIED